MVEEAELIEGNLDYARFVYPDEKETLLAVVSRPLLDKLSMIAMIVWIFTGVISKQKKRKLKNTSANDKKQIPEMKGLEGSFASELTNGPERRESSPSSILNHPACDCYAV